MCTPYSLTENFSCPLFRERARKAHNETERKRRAEELARQVSLLSSASLSWGKGMDPQLLGEACKQWKLNAIKPVSNDSLVA